MALTYTQAKATLDEIAERSERARNRMVAARELLAKAEQDLTSMATDYSGFVSELNTAAQSGGEAWLTAKAEKDEMVSDFQALKTRATSLISAFDGV